MGQIVFNNQKPKYCKLQAIRTGGQHVNDDVALNEVWLVDTTEAPKSSTGTGEYDAYIIGDGSHKAGQLELHYLGTNIDLDDYSTTDEMQTAITQAITNANIPRNLSQLNSDTDHQTVSQIEKDLWSAGGSGGITNNVDHEDLTSVEVSQGVSVIKFNDKDYNASTYSGLGKKYLRKNVQSTVDVITDDIPLSELTYKACYYTNQAVGGYCSMELVTNAPSISMWNCYKTDVKAGDTWIIKGKGGNSPRLWALLDKTTSTIIAVADTNANSLTEPVTLNIENDCILIVNSQSTPAGITYRTSAESASEKNLLTTAMMTSANTRYVIQYDYDLGGQTLELPQNCVLVFEGGSIKNGMIIGNGASIVADENSKIFDLTLTLSGVWHTADFYPEWFGAKGDMVNDDTAYIQKILNLPMTQTVSGQIGITCHLNNRYRVTDTLLINDDVHITGKSNVSLGKGSNTNGTILADFGEDWKKWVITTNNRNTTTRELLPYNTIFSHNMEAPYAYEYKGGGVKIDGINIRTVDKAYGGIRLGGLTDSSIDNVAIGGVYVGINRCTNWYSADSHLHINAYICGYACSTENNGHSLRDSYINAIRPSKDTEGVIWSKLVFTETTSLYDEDDNEIVLNEGDTITLYSQSMVYVNDSTTPVRIKRGSEFSANWYDENNSTEENSVYVPVTCYVEYNSSKPDEVDEWVLVPWWDYENKYIAPKWQYKKELLLASMPTTSWNTPSKYIFANKNVGYFQSYGNSVLSNVIMEIWNTGVYTTGESSLVDISPYREAIDGVMYVARSVSRINVIGAINGAFGDVDGHHRFHVVAHSSREGGTRIQFANSSFDKVDLISGAKVVFNNPNTAAALAFGSNVVRDKKEEDYNIVVGNSEIGQFKRTIAGALSSSWETVTIPENTTVTFDDPNVLIGDKYIWGAGRGSSILNINTPLAFYGKRLVFRKMTVNFNAGIGVTRGYLYRYYSDREIIFIGCDVNINGISLLSDEFYNIKLSFIGNSGGGGADETGVITLNDTASVNSYLSASGVPTTYYHRIHNIELSINHRFITTQVLDANGDPVTITEGNTTRNATIYDRIYATGARNSNIRVLNKLTYGTTAVRPSLSSVLGGFMYFDTTIGKPVWWNGSEWITWGGGEADDAKKMAVVAYTSTAPSTIIAEDNKYYRIDSAVSTLAITLPAITDTTTTHTIVFNFSVSTSGTPSITFTSANNAAIEYFEGYELEAGEKYEINAVYNGLEWIIAYGVVA